MNQPAHPCASPGIAGAAVIGVGLDLVDIPRFAAVLARRPSMSERLFTPSERAYASCLANPAPSLAARFAAKEAVMKAMATGLGAFRFDEVEVDRQPSGEPRLLLSGRAADMAGARGICQWLLSLTHTSTTAAAIVLALA
ncbi:MAG TPA: holo-ACP synthase [Acidimicrobiales bacterium]|nr:holo-ACP synthase [Acidimicrobiales bacterium]